MKAKFWACVMCGLVMIWAGACSKPSSKDVVLRTYPLDGLDGVIHQSGVEIDNQVKSEGRGALKITVTEPAVIRLFETGDLDIEDARLIYQARVRTENAQGNVYLEMWCHFEGKGEFFSRGLQAPLKGTNDWTTEEIFYILKKAENPDNVKLNLVCEGPGTVWIDNIRILKRMP
jgi:hypothetical protein